MDRRNFLKFAAASGVALMTPLANPRRASAERRFEGPYFLLIHAGGGWDPTYVCDPKGSDGPVNINKLFTKAQIGKAGQIQYAPVTYGGSYMASTFFSKYASKLLVVNGVDTTTGNHDTGTRVVWSGQVSEGAPSFAAVLAAAKSPSNPLGFITAGGYEVTGGLTSLTRLGSADAVRNIAYPNRLNPADVNNKDVYHTDATWDRINAAQQARLDALRKRQNLPRLSRGMNELFLARSADSDLASLASALPSNGDLNAAGNEIYRQALVAIAAFKTGVGVAANLTTGGFDTHGDHDNQQLNALGRLLQGVDLIMEELKKQGLEDKVIVAVGSDFGRTPAYNAHKVMRLGARRGRVPQRAVAARKCSGIAPECRSRRYLRGRRIRPNSAEFGRFGRFSAIFAPRPGRSPRSRPVRTGGSGRSDYVGGMKKTLIDSLIFHPRGVLRYLSL